MGEDMTGSRNQHGPAARGLLSAGLLILTLLLLPAAAPARADSASVTVTATVLHLLRVSVAPGADGDTVTIATNQDHVVLRHDTPDGPACVPIGRGISSHTVPAGWVVVEEN